MNTKSQIKEKCKALEELLLSKNEKYGDAALQPLNVFSNASAVTGIKVRIDDKLKRIMNAGLVDDTEDTLQDLAGYFILLMIAKDNESHDIQKRIRQDRSASHTITTSIGSDSEWEIEYTGI
jgi:hypothetical protein